MSIQYPEGGNCRKFSPIEEQIMKDTYLEYAGKKPLSDIALCIVKRIASQYPGVKRYHGSVVRTIKKSSYYQGKESRIKAAKKAVTTRKRQKKVLDDISKTSSNLSVEELVANIERAHTDVVEISFSEPLVHLDIALPASYIAKLVQNDIASKLFRS